MAMVLAKTYDFGFRNAQAIGDRNLADFKQQQNSAAASSVRAAFADYASGVARGQAAETKFFIDQQADDTHAAALKEHIDEVAQPYIAASPVAHTAQSDSSGIPVYRCVFSRGFVRLWNAAAGVSDVSGDALQAGSHPGVPALGTGADEAADSGVSQRDIIDWLVDYANVKRTDEAKLSAIRKLQPPASTPTATPASSVQ
ncbi:hypothetical protein AB3X91_30715 [Paraburkholderia sp. BR14263]|uniref:hypothetical protein n=1 Tax=unclassified Paraburkholderia TaxID=2615204 RepID=UPI0034CE821A